MTPAETIAQDMVTGTFSSHDLAEDVVRKLIDAGIPTDHISLLTQGLQVKEQVQGFITTGDVARGTAGVGAWTGGLFGLLAGAAFLWVPAFGPLLILGPLASAAIGAVEGGAIGGLVGAIMGKHMEKQHVPKIQTALQGGKFVVVVHGTREEQDIARRVMSEYGGEDVSTHAAAAAA